MRLVAIVCLAVSVVFMSGCVTTKRYKNDIEQLQSKVNELEAASKQRVDAESQLKDIEAAMQRQSEVNDALRRDLDIAKKRLDDSQKRINAITKGKGQEKSSLKMPSAKEIQEALSKAGFYAGTLDGVIGPGTKEAIRKFQEANQLTPDGVVGSKTWTLLVKYLEEK